MVRSNSRLEFNLSIISTIKDSISVQELLDRLAQLQEELSDLKQEEVDVSSLNKYRADLINKKILKHKDHGVRAYTACCLSDILRVYAPDAPYTDKELTEIFQLFLEQFRLLQDPENGYLTLQTYLVTNLLEYRSIVLLTDLPNSSQLVSDLFDIFYSPKNNAIQEKIFNIIGGLLGEVILECDTMPMTALKLVFNKFLSHKRDEALNGLSLKKDPGFEFSLAICQNYSNRLGRHFIKFYSEIIYEVLNDEHDHEKSRLSSEYKTLVKLGRLTSELWKYAPDLVGSITGFIYQLLCSENALFREAATDCVSEMLKSSSLVNFDVAHRDTYKVWLSKMADISPQVRHAWVFQLPQILVNRTDLANDISKGLAKALIDADHSVRLCAVQVFEKVPVKQLWECVSNPSVFTGLLHLTREARSDIREICIEAVSKIYVNSVEQISRSEDNREIWQVVETIPSVFFNLYYINDLDINMKIDQVLFEKFLPLPLDAQTLVNRVVGMMRNFDKKAFSSFYAFNKRQEQMSMVVSKLITFCENCHSAEISVVKSSQTQLEKTIEWLSSGFSQKLEFKEVLVALNELNDRRLYHLIKVAVDEMSNHSTVRNAISELFKRIEDPELFRKKNVKIDSRFTKESFISVIKVLIYRSSPIIYNISNLSILLSGSGSCTEAENVLKRQLIDNISVVNPGIFKDQAKHLMENIMALDGSSSTLTWTLTLSEAMKTLYKISKLNREYITNANPFFLDKLEELAKGDAILAAKYATKLLGLLDDPRSQLLRIKETILPLNSKSDYFAAHLMVLSQILKMQPQLLGEDSTEIVSLLIKEVLLTNEVVGDVEGQPGWISYNDLCSVESNRPLAAKVFSLKLFTNKLRVLAHDLRGDEMAQAFTVRILKLFFYLIASGGELISDQSESYPTPSNFQSQLRCSAGLQILKLAKISYLSTYIKPDDISKLVNLVEDESLEVRSLFIGKLKDYVGDEAISIKYLPLIFFTAYEPDTALRTSTRMWITSTLKKESFKKGTFFERALPRLVHLVAHHPDVAEGLKTKDEGLYNSLTTAIGYMVYYFHSVANSNNLALLYYLAGRVRQYRDTITEEVADTDQEAPEDVPTKDCGIYIISELAQLILGQLKDYNEWTLSPYPGKLNLPSDLFEPFETIEDARKNTFGSYLKSEELESLKKTIGVKIGRLYRRTTGYKQQSVKRPMNEELDQARKRTQVASRERVDGLRERPSDDDNYVPSKITSGSSNEVRKSTRQRKAISYADSESDNE
ncbi:LAME_0G15148g1_1 [Lachancea meyersii CBS 8951]|uniref:LAME_0G15148g1_1 n=1 Tax=Lachancea meyersii CBS 8951 TaxID=1266667 RepID=A0A1G4KAM1_9SACH|nr:LAME_0G15148g1_1 [Lachancea meyersii CBS 8951]